MTQDEAINFWVDSADRNKGAAEDMFQSGHYDWSLFLWHLVLEKTLKGLIVKKGDVPPPIHDLRKLATYAGVSIGKEKERQLKEITSFNLEARYDDYKRSFYHRATKQYALLWVKICEEIYLWLK